MAFSGCCAPVPDGGTSPGGMEPLPPAIVASRNGNTRGSGRHLAHLLESPGPAGPVGLEPGFPGWQLRPRQKGGEDIAYGWKGKGSTVHLLTEGNGLPLAFLVTAANVAEVRVGLKVVDQVRVPRPQGRPKQRPASLGADKSYDSGDFRQELRRRGIQPSVPCRKWPNRRPRPGRPPETGEASRFRWKVERSHGWLDNWRRLVTQYDWYTHSYVAFLTIACFMTLLSRILG
jgi:transposase